MSIPHFILIDRRPDPHYPTPSVCDAWNRALEEYLDDEGKSHFTVIEGGLIELPAEQLKCDCIVSPANSYGIMDGGYDLVLSRAFTGKTNDISHLSHHVQVALRKRWAGYAPPGSCTITSLPEDTAGPGNNPWGATTMAVIPTMRTPDDATWNRDLVYNCMWSLLVEIAHWNESLGEGESGSRIERVLMTGLGTGTGGISADRCAAQMMLAAKHFIEGVPEKAVWATVFARSNEVGETTEL